ncbi:MAG TPA: hypothetical protein VGF56_05395 [Rhizomicrobium sp.]|jgi:hypothetical protein
MKFVLAAMLALATAETAGGDTTRTSEQLWAMPPQEVARFAGVSGTDFIAKTMYSAVWLGGGVGGIVLFARPAPAGGGVNICTVETVHIGFRTDATGTPSNTTPYAVTDRSPRSAFILAKGDCARTPIAPDFMRSTGATNVFTAPSAEDASRGTTALLAVLADAHGAAKTLPFTLACQGNLKETCATARQTLASLDPGTIEEIKPCETKRADCLAVSGHTGPEDWWMEIALGTDGKPRDIAFGTVFVPPT